MVFDPVESGNLLNVSSATARANSSQLTSLIWTKGSYASASDADGDNVAHATAFTPAAGSGFIHTHLYSESSSARFTPGTLAADSNDLRAGLFTVRGDGNVGFQLAYELFVSAQGNAARGSANGIASVLVKVWNLSAAGSRSSVRSKVLETFFDGSNFVDGNRGRVNLIGAGLFFRDGDRGRLEVTLSSAATATVVPLPAGAWLLLAPALLASRRRRVVPRVT